MKALVVHFSFSGQTARVAEAMGRALGDSGYEATQAGIEFTDPKWSRRFSSVPMKQTFPSLTIATILPAQRLRRTGEIGIPRAAQAGAYDLVVIGSPTWWLTTNMPIRSYLKSDAARSVLEGTPFAAFSVSRRYWKGNMKDVRKLGEAAGGTWLGETHFTAAGGQVKSMLSWLGYMKHGEPQERVLGLKMPPPNLKPDFEQQSRTFIDGIAEQRGARPAAAAGA